jgi:N-methylhydantoinase A
MRVFIASLRIHRRYREILQAPSTLILPHLMECGRPAKKGVSEDRENAVFSIGIDTGGTFTDGVVIDQDGRTITSKAPTTPMEMSEGVLQVLDQLAEDMGLTTETLLEKTRQFAFGTTFATNALVSRQGVKTGLLTTRNFEDTHRMGRAMSRWAGLPLAEAKRFARTRKPEPIIPITLTRGINERIDESGSVVSRLNIKQAKDAIQDLVENHGAESIAVCFLWSFKNRRHEEEIGRLIKKMYPKVHQSLSIDIAPVFGEYERMNTTIIDAYVGPGTKAFLKSVSKSLAKKGLGVELLVFQADGGCKFISDTDPVGTIYSGPVAGVVASKNLGNTLGIENIITTDVGGTSFDVSVLYRGELLYSREPVMERFGVAYPCLEILSIGAGGGSIISVEQSSKVIRVGPHSAGAYPGPACYGFGGTEPTVTDALLVLGYLNPENFLSGRMKIYPDKAAAAMEKIAEPLGVDCVTAAAWAYKVVNSHMTDLLRSMTLERGYDPRDFVIFAYGGAASAHAAEYAADLGVTQVYIPVSAPTQSALGLALTDVLHSRVLSDPSRIPMDAKRFNKNFAKLEKMIVADLEKDGVREEDRSIRYFLEMRYAMQVHVVRVEIDCKTYTDADMDYVATEFDKNYERLYGEGSGYPAAGRFVNSFVVQGHGKTRKAVLTKFEMDGPDGSAALKGQRDAFFEKVGKSVKTEIYDYSKLRPGNVVKGPAIIEEPETTVVVPPGHEASVDEYKNLRLIKK